MGREYLIPYLIPYTNDVTRMCNTVAGSQAEDIDGFTHNEVPDLSALTQRHRAALNLAATQGIHATSESPASYLSAYHMDVSCDSMRMVHHGWHTVGSLKCVTRGAYGC